MLDINFIRGNKDIVKKGIADKQFDSSLVDKVLELDEKRRKLILEVEQLRAKRNKISASVSPSASPSPPPDEDEDQPTRQEIIEDGKKIKVGLREKEESLAQIEKDFYELLYQIPNPPADDVKTGKDDSENEVIRKEGEPTKFDFEPKDHLTIGQTLGIIDTETAAKISGSRFGYIKGDAALLEFALVQFAMETLVKEGFTPIVPPVLMKVPIFNKLGYSEHLGNENYYFVLGDPEKKSRGEEEEGYYLVGTSEHSVVPYYMDRTFDPNELPKRFVSFSTCFRREAGTYGKDTKGILRVHQFDKVEMVSFTKPEYSDKEHDFLLLLEEKLLKALEIPYQVVKMCSGDLGAPAARKYDLEGWIPSQNKYRELTSTSTCTDFQSRRLNIKYKYEGSASFGNVLWGSAPFGAGPTATGFVHTLNGTAFAIGRTIIAILENFQQKDGSVKIPEVLQKWMGKEAIK